MDVHAKREARVQWISPRCLVVSGMGGSRIGVAFIVE